MAIPKLSEAERKAALEKAKEARIKRAEVREQLKSGKLTLAEVIEMKDDPVVGRMKVSTLIETLHAPDVPELEKAGVISGGMLPKIESSLAALRAGVRKVHLVDGRMPHSLLLEIFTNKGVGTQIVK